MKKIKSAFKILVLLIIVCLIGDVIVLSIHIYNGIFVDWRVVVRSNFVVICGLPILLAVMYYVSQLASWVMEDL